MNRCRPRPEHGHRHGDHPRGEHEDEHPAELDRHCAIRRGARPLRVLPAAGADRDHEQDAEHDLEREADDQTVTVQRTVPPGGRHRAAKPGEPQDDQRRQGQQPHQPLLAKAGRDPPPGVPSWAVVPGGIVPGWLVMVSRS